MGLSWIVIEILAIIVENIAIIYFLNSRFPSRTKRDWNAPLICLALVLGGIVCTLGQLAGIEIYTIVTLAAYLFFLRRGTVFQKLIQLFTASAVLVATTLIGGLIAATVTNSTYAHGIERQDGQRLLALLLIKTAQITIYYIMSRRTTKLQRMQRGPTISLGVTALINLACLIAVLALTNAPALTWQELSTLIFIAAGLMLMTAFIIIMYELFMRAEVRNTELHTQVQRMEMEKHYFSELQAMYNDIRIWRHEYNNNLTALQALVLAGDADKTLQYIEKITAVPQAYAVALQTGDPALDAVVSTKLVVAQKQGISVNVQVIYPEQHGLETSDLCAIIGNLLDNAIEGCLRIEASERERFIDCSIQLKRRQLIISIRNSASRELDRDSDHFPSSKTGSYHGIGLAHIDGIVEKNQGYITRRITEEFVFETQVMLPLYPKEAAYA